MNVFLSLYQKFVKVRVSFSFQLEGKTVLILGGGYPGKHSLWSAWKTYKCRVSVCKTHRKEENCFVHKRKEAVISNTASRVALIFFPLDQAMCSFAQVILVDGNKDHPAAAFADTLIQYECEKDNPGLIEMHSENIIAILNDKALSIDGCSTYIEELPPLTALLSDKLLGGSKVRCIAFACPIFCR